MQQSNNIAVKVVNIPETRTARGALALGYGEAGFIYGARFNRQTGFHLDEMVNQPNTLFRTEGKFRGREFSIEPSTQAIAFVPMRGRHKEGRTIRDAIYDNAFDEDVFAENFGKLCAQLDGKPVTLVMSTPGTTDNPTPEDSDSRKMLAETIAGNHGLEIQWQFARVDLPQDARDGADISDIKLVIQESDLVFVANRRLERSSQTRQEVLRAGAEIIFDTYKPTSVVTPAAVGVGMHLAEVAVERGVNVKLLAMGDISVWSEANQLRLNRLLENPLVELHGQLKYEQGRINAVARFLNERAKAVGATRVVIDTPSGSETKVFTGAKNFWGAMVQLLEANNEFVGEVTTTRSEQAYDREDNTLDIDTALTQAATQSSDNEALLGF